MSNQNKLCFSQIFFIGTMLFALFFGAGNLIFPATLGQEAGSQLPLANAGFLVTGVLMPLLGVIALGFSGEKDFLALSQRSGIIFGFIFTTTLYLAIGPLFAIPRTGTVSFEIALKPFIGTENQTMGLLIFSLVYFAVSCLFALNPSKIVDIVGKVLTPVLLIAILILIVFAIVHPMGEIQAPTAKYQTGAFFTGFKEGYLTMDTLASCIFGIIVVDSITHAGVKEKRHVLATCAKSGLVAACLLALVYISVSYLGASSVEKLGFLSNGAEILSKVSQYHLGSAGSILLSIIVILACLTTSIGLTVACASYFSRILPSVSYLVWAIIFSLTSALFANFGLSKLIAISVPVLFVVYPLSIVMIVLTFLHKLFGGRREVYFTSLIFTLVVSLFEGFNAANMPINSVNTLFRNILPLYEQGVAWVVPAIVGGILGYFISKVKK